MGKVLLISCLFALATADPYEYPNTLPDREVMVHLFEWKWKDVAAECENFLQYFGYGAVQVSPPNEHITLIRNNELPWWVRYQPVSYKLISRSGTEEEFKDMVDRCNKVGVRIVVDTVINHMAGAGQKKGVGTRDSSGGSDFDATDGIESFPEVPYSQEDFNDYRCNRNISSEDYGDNPAGVRNCRLGGLLDLDQSRPYVQGKIIGYLNYLIDLGVAGFRVDASKHMWPADLKAIQDGVKNLREDIFGANKRPFFVHEVIDRGDEGIKVVEYEDLGRYTNFNYGPIVSRAARVVGDWSELKDLGPGYKYGNGASNDVLVFIDSQDTQRSGEDVITHKKGVLYQMAVAFMLAWDYGYPRVTSSYYFHDKNRGPPSEGPEGGWKTKSPTFKKDLTCYQSSGFVCEHRNPQIRHMAKWRSSVMGAKTSEIVTEYKRIAFARQGKGFFAINALDLGSDWSKSFQTTLPAGQYCDVWSGYLQDDKCTGKTITVGADGIAHLDIVRVIAISLASKIGGSPPGPDPPIPTPTQSPGPKTDTTKAPGPKTDTTKPPGPKTDPTKAPSPRTDPTKVPTSKPDPTKAPTPKPDPTGLTKTVILLKRDTSFGEYILIRGGTSHAHNGECAPGPYQQTNDKCAIPIKHATIVPESYHEYQSWSQNDNYLDFEGPETNQGKFNGQEAFGTPLAYSTNNPSEKEYQHYNKYGRGYWMVELLIDCTKTENGWFELKGYISPHRQWESDIHQNSCTGSVGGAAPFQSINHIAKCGAVNVFYWGSSDCIIDPI